MSIRTTDRMGQAPRQARAEAASWVARLHGPDRSPEVESGLKRWLAEDPAHEKAFELATEVWHETADLPGRLPARKPRPRLHEPGAHTGRPMLAFASVMALLLAALGYYAYVGREAALMTDVGEQRTMALVDGTRVELNTSSRLLVRYDDRVRKVVLTAGEAYFDVVRQDQRPFVVVASGREVVALGTAFVVRNDRDTVTVTLLEGRVAVAPSGADQGRQPQLAADVRVLVPGQRLKVAPNGPAVVDSPSIEKITAWQRGQIVFEDTPLREAAAEFNRYSQRKLRLGSTRMERIRVGGTFRVADVASFARAVAESNGLAVVDRGDEILLAPDSSE